MSKVMNEYFFSVPSAASRGPQDVEGLPSEASGNRSQWLAHSMLQKTKRRSKTFGLVATHEGLNIQEKSGGQCIFSGHLMPRSWV